MNTKRILCAVIVALLAMLACNLAKPTSVSPAATQSVGGTATGSGRSGSDGQVRFQDPLHGKELTVTFKDEQTGQPIEGIETWFASNGSEVLVIAHDPAKRYPDTARELRTSEARAIPLTKAVDLYQDFAKWKTFLGEFPDIEKWGKESQQLCVTPEQAGKGLGLASDVLIGFVTKGTAAEVENALKEVYDADAAQGTSNMLDGYAATQTPSILRFTVFSIGDGFPLFLRLDGFCLDPLDRQDPQSALRWLLYGVEQQELYPFSVLTTAEFYGYANYIEGGDPVSRETFLQDLAARLPSSHISCSGYEGDNQYVRVWTKGWSPPWEMTQVCYDGCSALQPPYQSSDAGFFLYNLEGEWWLRVNYVNTPEKYYFSPYTLTPCSQPELHGTTSSETPSEAVGPSCPGAPPQRVSVNGRAYVCTKSDSVFLRSEPRRAGSTLVSLPPGTQFTVMDGPRCADNWSWWLVKTDDGRNGWIAEGGDSIDPYFICPLQ